MLTRTLMFNNLISNLVACETSKSNSILVELDYWGSSTELDNVIAWGKGVWVVLA